MSRSLEHLTCPITWELFDDPITLPCCGQNCSRAAITESLIHNISCPMCRASLSNFNPATAPRNVSIAALTDNARGELSEFQLPRGHQWSANMILLEGTNVAELNIDIEKSRFHIIDRPTLFVAVIDRSGSMSGRPFQQLQSALIHIKSLCSNNETVQLSLIAYDSYAAEVILPDNNYPEVIRKLVAGGGTNFVGAFTAINTLLSRIRKADFANVTIAFMTDGQSGQNNVDLSNSFRSMLEDHHTEIPITVHCIGFGRACDSQLLESLRTCGSTEGMYRYAEPEDDGDTLCQKLTSLFTYSSGRGMTVPISVQVNGMKIIQTSDGDADVLCMSTNMTIDRKRKGTLKLWVRCPNDTFLHLCQVIVTSERDVNGVILKPIIENADNQQLQTALRERWFQRSIDECASTLVQLTKTHNTNVSSNVRELKIGLILQQLYALRCHNVNDERVSFMIQQLTAVRKNENQNVNIGKLSDMRFGSMFTATNVQTKQKPIAHALPANIITTTPQEPKMICWTEKHVHYSHNHESLNRNDLQKMIMDNIQLIKNKNVLLEKMRSGAFEADDFSHKDTNGNNALHLAAYTGQHEIVKEICVQSTKVQSSWAEIKNNNDETATSLAIKKRGYHKTLSVLLEFGATIPRAKHLQQFAISQGFERTANLIATVSLDQDMDVDTTMTSAYVEFKYNHLKEKLKENKETQKKYLEVALLHRLFSIVESLLSQNIEPLFTWIVNYTFPPKADHPETASYLDLLSVCLTKYPLLNKERDENGDTLLMRAVEKGSLPHVQFLLSLESTDVEATNALGNTALWLACAKRYPCILEELIKWGANVNCLNTKGNPPLYALCQTGPLKMVETLLAYGAVVETSNTNGDTLVLIACRNGQHEILRLLLNHVTPEFADIRAHIDGFNALFASVEANRPECILVLHEFRTPLEQYTEDNNPILPGATPLHLGAYYNSDKAVLELLKCGAQVNARDRINGMTPLHLAVIKGNVGMVHVLLKNGADKLLEDNLKLSAFSYCRNQPLVREALVDPAYDILSSLSKGQWEAVDEVVGLKVLKEFAGREGYLSTCDAIDVSGPDGMTPLMTAIIYSRFGIVEVLMSLNANPERKNRDGLNALFWAEWLRNPRIQKLVSKNGLYVLENDLKEKIRILREKHGSTLFLGAPPKVNVAKAIVGFSSQSSIAHRMGQCANMIVMKSGFVNREAFDAHNLDRDYDNEYVQWKNLEHETDLLFRAKIKTISHFCSKYINQNDKISCPEETMMTPHNISALNLYTSNTIIPSIINAGALTWYSPSSSSKGDGFLELVPVRSAMSQSDTMSSDFLSTLSNAMCKIKPHIGEVFFGVEGIHRHLFEEGNIFSWSRIVSASTLWPVATDALLDFKKSGVIFLVKLKQNGGCHVGPYSTFPFDSEVLLIPQTQFVVRRWYRGDIIALGQENIREHTFGIRDHEKQQYLTGQKPLIIEVEEVCSDISSNKLVNPDYNFARKEIQ